MPALGNAQQILMEDVMEEEEKEEDLANRDSIQLEPVNVGRLAVAAAGTINDELSSSSSSSGTHLDTDEDAKDNLRLSSASSAASGGPSAGAAAMARRGAPP